MVGILFLCFFILLFIGIPIGIAIGLASIIVLTTQTTVPLVIIPQRIFSSINSFPLLAIPFFMLAGLVMEKSGITERLINFANALLGWLKSGMVYVSIFTGMLMGGISGSAPADTAALSSVMIPTMKKMGYKDDFAASIQASAGSIGIVIPPSVPMIILGGIANISVGSLFLGGIIPGLLIGLCLMLVGGYISNKNGYGVISRKKFSMKELGRTGKEAILPILAPVIIIGGILSGVFTTTESGVAVVVYTLFLGIFVYKKIKIKDLINIFVEAIISTANVILIIGASSIFSWLLTRGNFPQMVSKVLFSVSDNPIMVLIAINIIFFIGGMFLEGIALMIMFVPILLPIAVSVGINPIAFGVMTVINIAIGTLTPPVGVCLFVASSTGNVNFEKVAKSTIPFVGVMLIVLFMCILFPSIITFIPKLMMK